MDIGEQDLVLRHPLEFFGEKFLDLVIQLGFLPDCILVRDNGAGRLVIFVAVAGADAGAALDVYGMAVRYDLLDGRGDRSNSVFIGFDFL